MRYILKTTELQEKYNIGRSEADVLLVIIDEMKNSRKSEKKDDIGYYIDIGRKEISEKIGVSPQTVNRAVKKLQELGLVIVQKKIRNSYTYFTDKMNHDVFGTNE